MVSQRQREAKKRFKEANPLLFSEPEPRPPKDPTKKKKNKIKVDTFKHKKSDSNHSNKSAHRKHLLRVPGMRPGESCYICKALDHIAKNCPKKSEWERNKICLLCRQRGHSLKNCSNKDVESADKKLCYNCGEMGHSLSRCPQPLQDGGTKYATCFICKEPGHLSKDCSKNNHGIYPKGGCCKICGGVTHLARDCPNKQMQNSGAAGIFDQSFQRPNRITKFTSGDDLEDDFIAVVPAAEEKETNVKTKNKQGPKVVNFVG